MAKEKVSINDIINYKIDQMTPEEKRVAVPRDFVAYRPKLHKNLVCPSYVHGYSLAIEYMKKWFLSKFDKNYFKFVHINGKHVLDDWKHFNNYNIVREKPMLAIVPTIDYDNDRDQRDSYLMDQSMMLKRSNFQQSFFKDYKRMNFLYLQMRELKMDFTFKVRVNSRSEQLDLFNRMELWFRIGSTQHEYISADFHVPYDIMVNIAESAGFEIKQIKNGSNIRNEIVDVYDFLSYINSHSDLPVIYKMRAINQRPEFFVRAKGLYTHISTSEKLQLDDGDRSGKLDTNFHIEMRCTLKIPIPHFYAYFCQEPIAHTIKVTEYNKNSIGIYTIAANEIPPENALGWGQIAVTGYMTEVGEQFIDLSPILDVGDLGKVIKYTMDQGLSPSTFIDLNVYRGDFVNNRLDITMDYRKKTVFFKYPETIEEDLDIVIYADKEYMNNILTTLEQYDRNRIASENKNIVINVTKR